MPDVLVAVASAEGRSLADLSRQLEIPKTSLHRLLGALEQAGYLVNRAGMFFPGPESARLAAALQGGSSQVSFPASARPVLDWLAGITGETAMLGALADHGREIVYLDVIESGAPLRYAPTVGDRRPLHAVPAGKTILAFLPGDALRNYVRTAEIAEFTPHATKAHELAGVIEQVRREAFSFDRDGYVQGASALASPIFGRDGSVRHAISVTGPTDRIIAALPALRQLTLTAAERLSRVLGFAGDFPLC